MIEAEIYRKESKRWDKLIPSLPYLLMVPFSNALKSHILFNNKEEQIDEMIELIETSQEPQMNNTIEEATPTILLQESLNLCQAHFKVNDCDEDGYIIEAKDLVDMSYPKTTPLEIEKYEPPPSPPIAPLSELAIALELKPLSDTPTDILPVIFN